MATQAPFTFQKGSSYAQTLEKLLEVSQSLVAVRNLSMVLQKVAESAKTVLGADITVLYEYEERLGDVKLPPVMCGDIIYPTIVTERSFVRPHRESAVFRVLESPQAFYAPNAREDWGQLVPNWSRQEGESGNFVYREGVTSSAAVCLRANDERVGVLFVNFRSPRAFTDDEKGTIELFAAQAALAISNARLMSNLGRQAKGHQTLNAFSATLAALPDEKSILGTVARSAADTFDCAHCSVFRVEGQTLVVAAAEGNRKQDLRPGRTFALGQGVAGWVATTGQSTLVPNTLQDERFDPGWSKDANIPQSLVVAPILVRNTVYGVISVEQDRREAYDEQDRQLLETLARQVGQAIQNTKLLQQERALREVSNAIAGALNLKDVAGKILDGIGTMLEYRSASIQLVEGNTRTLIAGRGFDDKAPDEWLLRPVSKDPLIDRIVVSRKPVILSDTSKEVDWENRSGTSTVKSWIGLPLLYGSETIGLLTLDHDQVGFYTSDLEEMLVPLANQAAIAIQNARLFQSERQRGDALTLLREISGKVSATLGLDETLASIVEGAMRLTGTSSGVIRLVDEAGQSVTRSFEYPEGFHHPLPRLSETESMTRTIIDTGLPKAVPDIAQERRVNQVMLEKGIKSLIGVPLKLGGKVIGVLYLNAEQPRQFTQDEQSLLLTLAEQAAVAVQNATLYEAERSRVDTIQVLQQISKSISETLDIDRILALIVEGAARLVGADSGVIHLVDVSKETLGQSYEFPEGSGHLMPRFSEKRGLTWKVFKTGQPVEVPDILLADSVIKERDWGDRRALIGLPIKLAGRVSGVLFLYGLEPRTFTSYEKDLLTTLAEQAALAIDNAQHYEQRARDIAALQEINLAITTNSLQEISKLITQKARELTKAEYGGMWMVDLKNPSRLVLGAMYGEGPLEAPLLAIDEDSINGWVAKTGKQYVSFDVRRDPHYRMWNESVQSSAAAPMVSRGELVGTLSIESSQSNAFSDYQLGLLQSLANQAAIAIENARLYEHISQNLELRIKELEVLPGIYEQIIAVGVQNIDRILDIVYAEACKVMDLSDAQVQFVFYDESNNEVTFPLAMETDNGRTIDIVRWGKRETHYRYEGEDEEVEAFKARPRAPEIRFGLSEYVIGVRESVLITENFEERANALTLGTFQVRVLPKFGRYARSTCAWLGVPMIVQGRVVGIISIQSLEKEHAFDSEQLHLLATVASQAAVAIENARLHEELRIQLEKKARDIQISREIDTAIVDRIRPGPELQNMLELILDKALERSDASSGNIMWYEQATRDLVMRASKGVMCGKEEARQVVGEGIVGLVAQEKKARLVNDVTVEPWRTVYIPFIADTRSELACPLLDGETLLGVLNVESPRIGAFDEEDARWLEDLAVRAVIAIRGAQAYASLRQEQDRRIAEEKFAYLGYAADGIAHRINNTIALLPLCVGDIRDHLKMADSFVDEQLEMIERNARYVLDLAEELQKPSRDSQAGHFDINGLVEDALRVAGVPADITVVTALTEDLPEIHTQRLLVDVFVELITNAIAAMSESRVKRLDIGSRMYANQVEVYVRDTGKGIPQEQQERLFDLFYTTAEKKGAVSGVSKGFGLWWLKTFLVWQGGDVVVESEPGQGATFRVRLPLEVKK